MVRHRIDRDTPAPVIFHWLLLSFLAGSINSGGLLACGRFVSHMTGFYTLFGQSAAHLRWGEAVSLLSIPIYFLVGTMISAYLVDRPLHLHKEPKYVQVMALAFTCLLLAAGLGTWGVFGSFGKIKLESDYLLLAILCMASGLLNAAVSCSSGHSVRISHMTGNTTDLGISIVRVLSLSKTSTRYRDERSAGWLRAGIIATFVSGSAMGAGAFVSFSYMGFLLPAGIALYLTLHEAMLARKHRHLLLKRRGSSRAGIAVE